MKFIYKMESVLITITGILCTILLLKLLYTLRSILPWRVNCWFCNYNFWVKFAVRNCWTCPKCEQYNGFTKDGDYNKPLITPADQTLKTPKVFRSPPKNGLCKMCNINQQLKVTQLANFIPMNEKKYEEEIETYSMEPFITNLMTSMVEWLVHWFSWCRHLWARVRPWKLSILSSVWVFVVPSLFPFFLAQVLWFLLWDQRYRMQLEKAYKLCSPCKKVLQVKLHKEKETLLGSKLLETRTPEKKSRKQDIQSKRLQSFINSTSKFIAGLLFILILLECCKNIMKEKNLPTFILNTKEIISSLLERVYSIIKMKTLMTFPSLENYISDINNLFYFDVMPKEFNLSNVYKGHVNMLTQKVLGGFLCLIQIIGLIWNINKLKYTIFIDLLTTVFMIISIATKALAMDPTIMSLVKLSSIGAVIAVYSSMGTKTTKQVKRMPITPPKRMKNLTSPPKHLIEDEEMSAMETDDDVSLSKYGLRDFSDSSRETINPLNNSFINGRSFSIRSNDSLWTKPKLNSTFCVNSVLSKSPSSVSDTVFIKPSFNKYQKLTKDDSDSDLDESISSLCIGSPKKAKSNRSIFSLRKFTATPNFVAPTPLNRSRPLISPSKLGHSTSWVAGGYWGSEGERQIFNLNGSRSSSQSSGFESQGSSMNQRNVLSQPSSREESVCGEPDKSSMFMDRFQNCNMNGYNSNYQAPQNFSRISSPVYPQMQYNSHVQIPQPRFAQQSLVSQNMFTQQQQYIPNNMFKTPGGSGLIKLPQATSFASR